MLTLIQETFGHPRRQPMRLEASDDLGRKPESDVGRNSDRLRPRPPDRLKTRGKPVFQFRQQQ